MNSSGPWSPYLAPVSGLQQFGMSGAVSQVSISEQIYSGLAPRRPRCASVAYTRIGVQCRCSRTPEPPRARSAENPVRKLWRIDEG
jgi:hypothetical protein